LGLISTSPVDETDRHAYRPGFGDTRSFDGSDDLDGDGEFFMTPFMFLMNALTFLMAGLMFLMGMRAIVMFLMAAETCSKQVQLPTTANSRRTRP